MYKGITLNDFIVELQKLAETRGEDELRSIGAASGKIFGLTSPYCLNFKDDKTEYIPAFAQDVRAYAVHAQGQGPSAKGQGVVSLRDDLNGADVLPADGDLISWDGLMRAIHQYFGADWNALDADCQRAYKIVRHYPGAEENDLVVRGELLGSLLGNFGCDLAYYGGQVRFFQEAVAFAPAVVRAEPAQDKGLSGKDERSEAAQGEGERAKGKGELRHVWARVGMTLDITPEEEKAIFEGDYSDGKEAVMRAIEAGRASVDGETYIPQECIEDFDEEYGTNYWKRDEECAYDFDGLRVSASPIIEKEQPLVAEVIASAQGRAVESTTRVDEIEFGME